MKKLRPKTDKKHRGAELWIMRGDLIDVINRYQGEGHLTTEEILGSLELVKHMVIEQERGYVINPDGKGPREAGSKGGA